MSYYPGPEQSGSQNQPPNGPSGPWGQDPRGGYQQYPQQQGYQQPVGGPGFGGPGGNRPKSGMSTGAIVGIAAVAVVIVLALVGGVAGLLVYTSNKNADNNRANFLASSTTATTTTSDYYSTPNTTSTPTSTTDTTTTTPLISYYGAIAISTQTGSVGYVINARTQASADTAAVAKCNATDCRTVSRFMNGCGAVAQSPVNLYWGWGWAPTRQGAIDQAIRHVIGENPKLLTAQCTSNAAG